MKLITIFLLLVSAILTLSKPQYPYSYVTPNPYLYLQPTFSNIYSYTTPYPLYGQNSMRIWPYVTGQYGYGYPPNTYGYDNNNWYNWYYGR